MIFYCSYKWIILAFLLIIFQTKFKKNIEKKNINKIIFVKKINHYQKKKNISEQKKIIILIDPGHGGQDPGSIGHKGLKEKEVTLKIAIKLKKLLDSNTLFQAVLTRNNDSYLSLKKRKNFLKCREVSLLLSIHADSAQQTYVSGTSIWIVSNNRIHREINNFINNKEEKIYFSKNIEDTFKNNENDIYLKKTILDLQFHSFQSIGMDLSKYIFQEFKKITKVKKIQPNYASLGILSSINTPSILIETGFITNFEEERKLKTISYQKKVANAIYISLKNYFQNKSIPNFKNIN
ncbi:N-acetylmuramoyl-L-alanine amidase [Buchnera aphidicola]|uniref:N-acetylmuramoyl-L-alanine amidase n=1 Tax=Buchnera aphidicola (Aphis gossypii) TaxID=98785 RepID=A0A5J6ZCV5_9GAMM|nr:N-acetylmuramoyl-L-alanine amidase [Buchnera aphidicola]QFQ31833.1 N-acetylmuramoyl-L-alanine amidase [Buchnera aphidicola (Aphis gossypii)]UPT14367.1 N-acetylmuramoyl-L-alanine amidase [Buchnera aphidicola (Aphis gossypii)]